MTTNPVGAVPVEAQPTAREATPMTNTDQSEPELPRIWSKTSRSDSTYRIFVASPSADRMTVWHLRDFVRALDAAGIPDDVRVVHNSSPERGLSGLHVHHDVTVEKAIAAGDATAPTDAAA